MTRGNARELAVHLIYSREFTGQEPEQEVAVRLDKEYYPSLSQENAVYADRPSAAQLRYIDIETKGTTYAGTTKVTVDVDVDPLVYMVGLGYKF